MVLLAVYANGMFALITPPIWLLLYSYNHYTIFVVVGWDSREVDGGVLALLAEALSNPIMWLNYLFA